MKTILINPANADMELFANSIRILNEFKRMGFDRRDVFLETIIQNDHNYNTLSNIQKLQNFWSGRVKDEFLNADLDLILEKLRVE